MAHWLYPANTKFYDVLGAFQESATYWPMNSRVSAGDVIYIYLAAPHKQIGFVCDVVETGFEMSDILKSVRPFIKGAPDSSKADKPFMKLKASRRLQLETSSPLGLPFLKENGLNGMLMGPRNLGNNPLLLSYIERTLDEL